jgi:undecaprenyl-diphosphatase
MSQPLEANIILAIQRYLSSSLAVSTVIFCARWLIYLFIPFALLERRSPAMRHAVYEATWTALLAFSISTLLASVLGRIRPFLANIGVHALVSPNLQAGSFPSSHTAIAIGVATALAFADTRVGIVAFIMAFLVAFGRVAAGMHYPSDVLGGAIVGVISFMIVRAVHFGLASL